MRPRISRISQNVPTCPIQTHRCPNGLVLRWLGWSKLFYRLIFTVALYNKDPQKIPALQLTALKNNTIMKMERGHTYIRHPPLKKYSQAKKTH